MMKITQIILLVMVVIGAQQLMCSEESSRNLSSSVENSLSENNDQKHERSFTIVDNSAYISVATTAVTHFMVHNTDEMRDVYREN